MTYEFFFVNFSSILIYIYIWCDLNLDHWSAFIHVRDEAVEDHAVFKNSLSVSVLEVW